MSLKVVFASLLVVIVSGFNSPNLANPSSMHAGIPSKTELQKMIKSTLTLTPMKNFWVSASLRKMQLR
jgi:hypothetical protein